MLLLTLITLGFVLYFVHNINVCKDECYDAGCSYTIKQGAYKGCDCWPSEGSQFGNQCENIKDICNKYPEFINVCGGHCKSFYGVKYCYCNNNSTGDYCEITSK